MAGGCGSQIEYGSDVASSDGASSQANTASAESEAPPFTPNQDLASSDVATGSDDAGSNQDSNQDNEATEKEPVSDEALMDWIAGETDGLETSEPTEAPEPAVAANDENSNESSSDKRYPWESEAADSTSAAESDFGSMLAGGNQSAASTESEPEPAVDTYAGENADSEADEDGSTEAEMNSIFGFDDAETESIAESQPTDRPEEEPVAASPSSDSSADGGFGSLLAQDLKLQNKTPEEPAPQSEPTLADVEPQSESTEPDYAGDNRYGTTADNPSPPLLFGGREETAEEDRFVEPSEEPMREPAYTEALPEPQTPEYAAPRMAAYEPTPLPMDVTNTRRLAWLLGGRISLEVLGQIDRSDDPRVQAWETDALAELLDVPSPRPEDASSASPEEAITALLGAAKPVGDRIAREHDVAHAALMEIALKTNALLKLYDARPELAKVVGRSVEAAAERASLPDDIWRPFVDQLASNVAADDMQAAVYRLHADVEQWLRQ